MIFVTINVMINDICYYKCNGYMIFVTINVMINDFCYYKSND